MGHAKKTGALDYILWLVVLGLSLWGVSSLLSGWESFLPFMEENFSLTNADIKMIPVGALLFFLFWVFCDKIIFKPYVQLVEARELATTGAEDLAKDTKLKTQELEKDIEKKLLEAKVRFTQEKMDKLNIAAGESKKALDSLNQQSQSMLLEERKKISEEVKAIRDSANAKAESLVAQIVEKTCQV